MYFNIYRYELFIGSFLQLHLISFHLFKIKGGMSYFTCKFEFQHSTATQKPTHELKPRVPIQIDPHKAIPAGLE